MAQRLAKDLANCGLVIASGLARRIDSCAHKGALSSDTGATIGVFGLWYRRGFSEGEQENFRSRSLNAAQSSRNSPWELFLHRGTSRFGPGSLPVCRWVYRWWKAHSVLRLADYSPAGHGIRPRRCTAYQATRRNLRPLARISLIKQGAKLVTSWEDVIEELPTSVRTQLLPVEAANSEERAKLVHERSGPGRAHALRSFNRGRIAPFIPYGDMVEPSGLTSSEVLAAYLTWSSKAWYVSYLVSNS